MTEMVLNFSQLGWVGRLCCAWFVLCGKPFKVSSVEFKVVP